MPKNSTSATQVKELLVIRGYNPCKGAAARNVYELRIRALFLNNTVDLHTAVISWETYHVSCSTWSALDFPIFGHRKIYITQSY